jgi:hypothetical protein
MGFKHVALAVALLVACSSPDASTKANTPPQVGAARGSQTGGEGSIASCKSVSITEIDAEQARMLDFPVDAQLALFDQAVVVPFHRGDVDCSMLPARVDGHIQIKASLRGIDRELFEPALPEVPDVCPAWQRELLRYRAVIDLTTDEGTLMGSFAAIGYAGHPAPGTEAYAGLVFWGSTEAELELKNFAGSLGVRVDPSRAHTGHLRGSVALGATVWASSVFTTVDYTDGGDPLQDQGDVLFWPSDFPDLQGAALCNGLAAPGEQRDPISIDDYNRL